MYTIKQFCELFQVSRTSVMIWIREGKVHPVKIGNKWMFSQEEIDRIKKEGVQ